MRSYSTQSCLTETARLGARREQMFFCGWFYCLRAGINVLH